MDYRDFIWFERFPTTWCPGCGSGIIFQQIARAFADMDYNRENLVVVSGIGCAGRTAGYFNLDTVHALHGRAIPVAEGIKRANPDLNVVVISGDGDLAGIGGGHLIHSARRDSNITVICINNEIYGMTGGQMSPTSKKGVVTLSSPFGNPYREMNLLRLIKVNERYFFARTTVFHVDHLKEVTKLALEREGFSFVEIISNCIENMGRRMGYKSAHEMLLHYRDNYKIVKNKDRLEDNELGVLFKE